jgi:hypothetical protein
VQSNAKKKVDKKFSAAWSGLPVVRFWLAADYDCILGCLAECKKSEKKFSILEKLPQTINRIKTFKTRIKHGGHHGGTLTTLAPL